MHIGGPIGGFAEKAVKRIAGIATESLINGTDFGDNIVASLPGFLDDLLGDKITRAVKRFTHDLITNISPSNKKPATATGNIGSGNPADSFRDRTVAGGEDDL